MIKNMSVLKKSSCGLVFWMIFHISVFAQAIPGEFSSIPKSGTALVYTHQNDDLLWILPFWNITEKFIGGAMPSGPSFKTLVHQQ